MKTVFTLAALLVLATGKAFSSDFVLYGEKYTLRNMHEKGLPSYLDTRDPGCENYLCVSATTDRNRIYGSRVWVFISDTVKPGEKVYPEDTFYLQNQWGSTPSYLEIKGRGCFDNDWCVSVSMSKDGVPSPERPDASTTKWTLLFGGEKHLLYVGSEVKIASKYPGGGYLDVKEYGCNGNRDCVSTSINPDRAPGTNDWVIEKHVPYP